MRKIAMAAILMLAQPALAQSMAQSRPVAAAAAAGISLTCTTYTDLNGATFAADRVMLENLSTIRALYKTNGQTFPNATAVPAVIDKSGKVHSIATLAEFTALDNVITLYANQLASYLAKVQAGQSPTMPPNTSSAC